ncbi:Kinesin-9 [Giardia muris]|uniref:Kinesin-like protein n=1 Tax=Giardia muris TaxID=5742 RepID=A0A4Z1T8N3_GIAMU|nr:Kinesin-9 [Giardia muris]|eukprot:TNJ30483.1 Kinesin-9 [Giardia muris]
MGRAGTIQVHARIRPPGANPAMKCSTDAKEFYAIDYTDNRLQLNVPKTHPNMKSEYSFTFDHIYDAQTTQVEVYDRLTRPLIQNFIDGFNCTVFAYGQTGSGKSYSMTGGAGSYNDRGLMPRALEQIFGYLAGNTSSRQHEIWVSYIQIFNEIGYDLLGIPGELNPHLEDLPRVTLQEDSDGALHVKGLSAHKSDNVESALNILWNGDLNRIVCATSQNQASSRSHCIFTIHMRSKEIQSDVVRQSKFNFVDLAGSERVAKTHADGSVLQQARYINQSLFFLEQVIHALGKRQTDPDCHVPYRNSMMTMFLRDSIGGNCKTIMLATIAVEPQNLGESVSTAQFAMSVGRIENKAAINEDIDPKLLIKRLKAENKALKEELKLLKEGSGANAARTLASDDEEYVKQKLNEYLADKSIMTLDVGSWVRLQYAIRLLRDLLGGAQVSDGPVQAANAAELDRLRMLLQQRDAEVEILAAMVGEKSHGHPPPITDIRASAGPMYTYDNIETDYSVVGEEGTRKELRYDSTPEGTSKTLALSASSERSILGSSPPPVFQSASAVSQRKPAPPSTQTERIDTLSDPLKFTNLDVTTLTVADLKDESGIFGRFLKGYYLNDRLNSDRESLKTMYASAKSLAEVVKASKTKADGIKAQILSIVERSGAETEETDLLKNELTHTSAGYRQALEELKNLKVQIEALEADLQHAKKGIKNSFVQWYSHVAQIVAARERELEQKSKDYTGYADVDEDIAAFYKASRLIKQQ